MNKKIQSALISVFYKDGIDTLAKTLQSFGVKIYSTGGTQKFLEAAGVECIAVESVTSYPSILGGRVKTLHPKVFGGILGKRSDETHLSEMKEHEIPELDLVIVDLYPFEETLATTTEEAKIIEKIDIGGPSMLRAAAKNFADVCVIGSMSDYSVLGDLLVAQNGETTLEQRKTFAAKTFKIVTKYDIAIDDYFNPELSGETRSLRYGENPHQEAKFIGNLNEQFEQLNGKELSYNNLVDVDGAVGLLAEFEDEAQPFFAVFKHTNVCGAALRENSFEAWKAALAGDPESAFGGVIISNQEISKEIAEDMSGIFFEVLMAPSFSTEALEILSKKKNRILLKIKNTSQIVQSDEPRSSKTILGGRLLQNIDVGNYTKWEEVGARESTEAEKTDLKFANLLCKHLKSNAIALVKNKQLIGKGCGQTSRIDALRHSISKAQQFEFDLNGAVLASDAFFPFDDVIKISKQEGISACIQPGGSIRDKDSIAFAKANDMVMVMTGMRHFKH